MEAEQMTIEELLDYVVNNFSNKDLRYSSALHVFKSFPPSHLVRFVHELQQEKLKP